MLAGVVTLVAAAFIVYGPALHGDVLWDDLAHITRPELRSLSGLYDIWFTLEATQQVYPLLHSAFWVEWQLWQDNTFAYHVVNVLQHAVAACLLWGVLRKLRIPGAFLAAAIFVVHPVNVESVAWITEQKNTLSVVFYLGAAWCYLKFEERVARARAWYALAFALFVLGLLTKTVIATLPAALLVVGWWRRGRLEVGRDVVPLVPWFALGAAAGTFTAWYERVLIGAQGVEFDLDVVQRVLLAGRVIWFYLHKLIWPAELIFFYPRWVIDPTAWTWWIYPIGVAAVVAVLVTLSIRIRLRAPMAGFLFFVGTLFPVLGFLNVYPFRFSYVADHFQYVAELGIVTLVAGGLVRLAQFQPAMRTWIYAGATVIVATLGWLAWKQSDQYGHDAIHHYQAILERNPDSWISYENWGAQLMNEGQYAEALPLLHKASALNPDYFEAMRDLGTSYDRLGRLKEALPYYERAARLHPDPKAGENFYGGALLRDRQADEAIRHFQRAIDLAEREGRPIFGFHLDLGRAYLAAGKLEAALAELRLTQQLAGRDDPAADALLGDTLVQMKRSADAVPYLTRAIAAGAGDAIHRFDLGRILFDEARYAEACPHLEASIRLRPDLVDAYIVLALARFQLGQQADAREAAHAGLRAARPLLPPDAIRSIEQVLAPILGVPAG